MPAPISKQYTVMRDWRIKTYQVDAPHHTHNQIEQIIDRIDLARSDNGERIAVLELEQALIKYGHIVEGESPSE